MKKLLFLILLFCITIIPSFASSWVQIDDNIFIDKDSIKTYVNNNGIYKYNQKTFWIKYANNNQNYEEIEKNTKKKVGYHVSQYLIDYSNNTIATKSCVLYTFDGKVISSYTWDDIELKFRSIVPNSIGEASAKLVKKTKNFKKDV